MQNPSLSLTQKDRNNNFKRTQYWFTFCKFYLQKWLHHNKCLSEEEPFNPLSPNGDQQQFSPNNVHTLSRDKVVRIQKMIMKEKMPWSFIKFSQLILKGKVRRSVWRICLWILGLKGLKVIYSSTLGNYKDRYFINVGPVV